MPDTQITPRAERSAPGTLLHYSIILTGIGTVFLGPLLPSLTRLLALGDAGGGSLLAAQFAGAFLGGWTTGVPLRRSMLRGYAAAVTGYTALALVCAVGQQPWAIGQQPWAVGRQLWAARVALLVLGFGIGQLLTSTNLIASVKWAGTRGRALTLLNFSWSAGALATALLLSRLLRHFSLPHLLFSMAFLLLFGGGAALLADPTLPGKETRKGTRKENRADLSAPPAGIFGLPRTVWAYFALLLFIYGGVETCLSEWLTTFDTRYGGGTWHGNPISQTAFWGTLTATRAVAPALMLRLPERLLLRLGLATATVALLLLLSGHVPNGLCASLAGLSLAVWFPLVLTAMIGEGARPRQVGQIIAVSGLGASAFQWMMGHLSQSLGSLREALWLPLAGIVTLFALSYRKSAIAESPATPAKSV